MEVKGIAITPMRDYVKSQFGSRYEEWLNSLSAESRKIVINPLASNWYPFQLGLMEPTQKVCALFHKGDEQGAWQVGRYSADHALKGIYSIFVKLGSPGFIVSRGTRIITQYYNPSELKVIENQPKKVVVQMVLGEPNSLIEKRIGGWMERAIEMSGQKIKTAKITKSMVKGDPATEYLLEWE